MTPGQKALAEAARLEAARVYGGVIPDTSSVRARSLLADRAEAELAAAARRRTAKTPAVKPLADDTDDPMLTAIAEGMSNHEVIERFGASYPEVRAARKKIMSEGAA